MTSADRDALFAAILAAPDDDLPRLVFADYLEEQGHPALAARAAFIRLQIAADKLPPDSARRLEWSRQIGELRPLFRDEWAEAFAPGELSGCVVNYHRGFADEIQIPVEKLILFHERIFAAAPVCVLRLIDDLPTTTWDCVSEAQTLRRLRTLQLGPHSGLHLGSTCATLLREAPLTNLLRLELSGNSLDDRWAIRFAREYATYPLAGSVVELDLARNDLTDAAASTLAAASWPVPLHCLRLTGNRLTPEGVSRLQDRFGAAVQV
ncbi:MAG: TIGR02996 domain-containing protein [Bacteroidales bacterium]|nr:TIGR02996 domain-containing protein [Bacteroidales bacterium]